MNLNETNEPGAAATAAQEPSWLKSMSGYHASAAAIVDQLREIADAIEEGLGDARLSEVALSVGFQALTHRPHRDRVAAVDALAAALQIKPQLNGAGGGNFHYTAGHYTTPVRVYTEALSGGEYEAGLLLAAERTPRPLVSDETIAEAEQISKMVAPTDLGLPQAPCGCPIWGTVVDHCAACKAVSA